VPNVIPGKRQRFDFWGAGLLLVSLSCFLIGLTLGESVGYGSLQVISLLLGFALSLVIFLVVENRVEYPMIDLGMFRNALFSVNLVTGFITFIGLSGSTLLMPFYLENVRGYTPQVIGLMLAVVPIMLGITAPISGMLSDKVGTRPLTVIGLAMLIVGYATVATLQVDTSIAGYMLRYVPIGLGMGMFQSPNNNAIMSSVPRERFGVASGLLSLTRTLGQVTGIATLGAIWTGYVLRNGSVIGDGVLSASPVDQVAALQGTMHVVMFAMIFAFLLSLTAWGVERRRKTYSPAGDVLAEK
jgi:MFS family permease